LPAVSKGIKSNVSSQQGMDSLIGALTAGGHHRYLEDPDSLANNEAVDDGNAILGHIFGNKDVSRNVASYAAEQTGTDVGTVKRLLPLVANLAMGALSKQVGRTAQIGLSTPANANPQNNTSISDMLFSVLDSNHDGDISDDLLNLAKKFF
jgi:hypothetical protein